MLQRAKNIKDNAKFQVSCGLVMQQF